MSSHTPARPQVLADPRAVRGAGGVRVVVRRELATKFFTKAFAISTVLFALLAAAGPLLTAGGGDDVPVLAHTSSSADLAGSVEVVGGDAVELEPVSDEAVGRALVEDGEADALLLTSEDGVRVLVEDSLAPQLGALLQAALHDRVLRETAEASGVDLRLLADAATAAVEVVVVGEGLVIADVVLALGFAAGAVLVVLLWGIPLATDVMQEKASRVVELLLTSVRPWQLLTGKVIAITVIGLTQLVVALGAGLGALALTGSLPDVGGMSWSVLAAGAVGLVLNIVTCNALMAGLAARVERQEDLSSALQPALALALVPMAAASYLVFDLAETLWLDVASMAPVLNTLVMPARLAVEPVPAWQLGLSLALALATTVAAFAVAGRVYSGSVLRSGGPVSLREALRSL